MDVSVGVEPAPTAAVRGLIYLAEDELNRRYGRPQADPPVDVAEFTPPQGGFVVARLDSHPVGGVGVRRLADHPSCGEVKRLWVRPDLRRAGVATALMAETEDVARALGLATLFLETGYAQPEALAFYARRGWSVTTEVPMTMSCHQGSTRFRRDLVL